MSEEAGQVAEKAARPAFRPSLVVVACIMAGIVWLTLHYTGVMFTDALDILKAADEPVEVKDAVINLLGALTGTGVAIIALNGLSNVLNKLAEK